jgi:hypothetical protein
LKLSPPVSQGPLPLTLHNIQRGTHKHASEKTKHKRQEEKRNISPPPTCRPKKKTQNDLEKASPQLEEHALSSALLAALSSTPASSAASSTAACVQSKRRQTSGVSSQARSLARATARRLVLFSAAAVASSSSALLLVLLLPLPLLPLLVASLPSQQTSTQRLFGTRDRRRSLPVASTALPEKRASAVESCFGSRGKKSNAKTCRCCSCSIRTSLPISRTTTACGDSSAGPESRKDKPSSGVTWR